MKIAHHRGSVITKLGIGCVICLLLGFGILLSAQEQTKSEFIGTKPEMDAAKMETMAKTREQAQSPQQPQRNRDWGRQNRGEGVEFGENAAFYKTIIDHNLFRPLGWTPPNTEPSYSLIGTAVGPNGSISQATLLERRSNRYHFVTIGTKLDDMTVKDIQDGRVVLDNTGEDLTLKTGEFQPLTIKRERGDRGGDRGEGGSERADNNNAGQNRDNQVNAERRQSGRNERATAEQRTRQGMMERMRNASPEERREMIEQFRRRASGRRGRGRD